MITKKAFLPLYVYLTRPINENASQAVLPYLQIDMRLVRRLQKPATRLVKCLWYFQYERQLERLGLPSFTQLRYEFLNHLTLSHPPGVPPTPGKAYIEIVGYFKYYYIHNFACECLKEIHNLK